MRKASTTLRTGYQKGYSLGNRGGATPKAAGETTLVKGETPPTVSSGRTGGRRKGSGKEGGGGGMNVSYSDTIPVTDLQTVADFSKDTKAGKALGVKKAVDYAKQKGDQGSGFNLGKRR
jgi:hypothetical protein